jgi:hypothetical protein
MIERKRKIRLIQLSLLIFGIFILYFTYVNRDNNQENKILTKETQKKVRESIEKKGEESDIFYNIEYSGLDFEGNRYIIKSKEAFNTEDNRDIVNMKNVEA